MTKTLNQLNEATTLADDDLLLARDTSAVEDKRITTENARSYMLSPLTSTANGQGASLVSMEGGPTVEEAVNQRAIYVGSVAELEALSLADGVNVYLTENNRSGSGTVKTGTPPSDPQKGIYIVLANGNYWERDDKDSLNVGHFGATYSGDESPIAQAMLDLVNYIRIPKGKVFTFKNLALKANSKVYADGTAKMPDGCADFDRLVYGDQLAGLRLEFNELDGNAAGQSGQIGTHLVYLTRCAAPYIRVKSLKDHYYPRSFTTAPSPDGFRNDGSGAIFIYRAPKAECYVDRMENWGHEGVYILECDRSIAYLGMGQGSVSGDEYSGIQQSGDYCQLLYAKTDLTGASGIGFDSRFGTAGKLVSTRSRFFNGVNLGHSGYPSDGAVIESIVVDGCNDDGISIVASSLRPVINNFTVRHAGRYGINQSDGANESVLSNGAVYASRVAQVRIFDSEISLTGVDIAPTFPAALDLSAVSGDFAEGETVTGGTSGATAFVEYVWDFGRSYLQVSGITGTFSSGETVTGGTSGATATIDSITSPVKVSKGGTVVERFNNVRLSPDIMGTNFQSIGGLSSVVVTNGNVRASKLPKFSPSNPAGAQAGLYISTITDGSFTVATADGTAAGGGAGFRYDLN